ncbi:type II toxin-antitoxin system RelE/ParE family toxin [Methylobacter tundripaludum]|jgi:Plasmid stabilisation system protein.|uniref:type II toxin-antitoxin system RelE/ParE family toxin n=1 Tax=Methylobacter tundripaludum TaxID=173365 RepID=UPI0004891156|nr:type II toxin-antitoxin system RelE/ParE family toxin [Methylobacter tundripaludum]
MDYEVTLSLSARRDLEDVVRYISADAPERAIEFGRFLISSVKSLGQFPEKGRVVPEFGNPVIREIVARSYRVIYRINHESRKIEVIRFWHGKRDMSDFHI